MPTHKYATALVPMYAKAQTMTIRSCTECIDLHAFCGRSAACRKYGLQSHVCSIN